jgi:hypothetical protein
MVAPQPIPGLTPNGRTGRSYSVGNPPDVRGGITEVGSAFPPMPGEAWLTIEGANREEVQDGNCNNGLHDGAADRRPREAEQLDRVAGVTPLIVGGFDLVNGFTSISTPATTRTMSCTRT